MVSIYTQDDSFSDDQIFLFCLGVYVLFSCVCQILATRNVIPSVELIYFQVTY